MVTTFPSKNDLAQFNRQILQCQDDAYTLAWYLLGNEQEAETITQAAVNTAFLSFSWHPEACHLLILQQVRKLCQNRKAAFSGAVERGILYDLLTLPEPERLVLVLVEILELSYTEVAFIADQPMSEVMSKLAQARRRISERKRP